MFLSTILPWGLVAVLSATVLYFRVAKNHKFEGAGKPFPMPWTQTSRNNETLRTVHWMSTVVIIVLAVAIAVLVSTRQDKELVFVEFPKSGNHLVRVLAAGKDITANKALVAATLQTYVYERELIDGQTEFIRYPRVLAKSTQAIWNDFDRTIKPLLKKKGLKQSVEILSERKLADGIHEIEYEVTATIDGKIDPQTQEPWERVQKFEATMTYDFRPQEVEEKDKYNNPTGIFITNWTRSKVKK